MNAVKQVHDLGQSIWLDFIDRPLMNSGQLQQLIEDDGIRGITWRFQRYRAVDSVAF